MCECKSQLHFAKAGLQSPVGPIHHLWKKGNYVKHVSPYALKQYGWGEHGGHNMGDNYDTQLHMELPRSNL